MIKPLIISLTLILTAGTQAAETNSPAPAEPDAKTVRLDIGTINYETNKKTGDKEVEIQLGDNLEAVRDAYGKPLGTANRGDLQIVMYPRGQVEMKNGKVVAIKMISERTYEAKKVRKAHRIEMEKKLAEKEKEERLQQAEDKLAEVLADPAFDEKTPVEQVTFWRGFKKDNPELDIEPFLKEALSKLKDK